MGKASILIGSPSSALNLIVFLVHCSRAILTYLVSAYSKEDGLYPRDIRVRAVVDQRLQFDLGTLYARLNDYYVITRSFNLQQFNKLMNATIHSCRGQCCS